MKNKLFKLFGKVALPTLLAGTLLAFSPVAEMAAERGGGHSAGRSFAGSARGFGGGRAYAGGRNYSGNYGGNYEGRNYGGGYYRGGRYYGGGLYLGVGGGYAPAPCGFYDRAGYWHAGCYGGPAVY